MRLVYSGSVYGKKNVILIDKLVKDYQQVVDSCNSDTFPIVYSTRSSGAELLSLLKSQFKTIDRIGLFFHGTGPIPAMFLDGKPLFIKNERSPYSGNTKLMIDVIKSFGVRNVDYFACDTLKYDIWKSYYEVLAKETGVKVGASDDATGNMKYGGDWIMESSSEDVELVYFGRSVEAYRHLLNTANQTFILTGAGLYCAGNNQYGQLGTGTTNSSSSFVKVTTLPAGVYPSIIANSQYHTWVIGTDGSAYVTGYNGWGEFGNGTTDSSSSFVKVDLPDGLIVSAISCGWGNTAIIGSDGKLYVAGDNSNGQLGVSGIEHSYSFVNASLPEGITVTDVVVCSGNTVNQLGPMNQLVIIGNDGNVYATGAGNSAIFTKIVLPDGISAVKLAGGYRSVMVIGSDTNVYGTGQNYYGELGNGTTDDDTSVIISGDHPFTKAILPEGVGATAITCGFFNTMIIGTDFNVYGTGYNGNGQFGIGATTSSTIFVKGTLPDGITATGIVSGGYFTMVNGGFRNLYGAGYDANGQLGIVGPAPTENVTSFTHITTAADGTDLTNNVFQLSNQSVVASPFVRLSLPVGGAGVATSGKAFQPLRYISGVEGDSVTFSCQGYTNGEFTQAGVFSGTWTATNDGESVSETRPFLVLASSWDV